MLSLSFHTLYLSLTHLSLECTSTVSDAHLLECLQAVPSLTKLELCRAETIGYRLNPTYMLDDLNSNSRTLGGIPRCYAKWKHGVPIAIMNSNHGSRANPEFDAILLVYMEPTWNLESHVAVKLVPSRRLHQALSYSFTPHWKT
jgi:hypothetical protein